MKKITMTIITLIGIFIAITSSFAQQKEVALTTIMPMNYDELRVKDGATGDTYKNLTDAQVTDNNLVVKGNIGVGTNSPTTAKGNTGIIDTDDVWLGSIQQWAGDITKEVALYNLEGEDLLPDTAVATLSGTAVRKDKLVILVGRTTIKKKGGLFSDPGGIVVSWKDAAPNLFTNIYAVLISGETERSDLVIRRYPFPPTYPEPPTTTTSFWAGADSEQMGNFVVIGD